MLSRLDQLLLSTPLFTDNPSIYVSAAEEDSQFGGCSTSCKAFIDSLNDEYKNQIFYQAIKKAVDDCRERGVPAVVLDIGMGGALNAMMAIAAGADFAYAAEIHEEIFDAIKAILVRNGMEHQILLIHKPVLELELNKDVNPQPTICVMDKFDSNLLRYENLDLMTRVQYNLLAPDCIYIPDICNIYAQMIECDYLRSMSTIDPVYVEASKQTILLPPVMKTCSRTTLYCQEMLLDGLEVSEVPFKKLSPVLKIFEIDWKKPGYHLRNSKMEFLVKETGRVDGVFCWWEMILDQDGKLMISNEPSWVAGEPNNWRYHWQQTAHFGQNPLPLSKGIKCYLESFHDSNHFWFRTTICPGPMETALTNTVQKCGCGIHRLFGTYKMGIMNDLNRTSKFIQAMEKVIKPGESVCLCVGNSSLMPLICQALGAAKIYVVNTDRAVIYSATGKLVRGVSDNDKERCQFILKTLMGNRFHLFTRFVKLSGNHDVPLASVNLIFGDPHLQGWQTTPNTCETVKPGSYYTWNTVLEQSWFTLKYWYTLNLFSEGIFAPGAECIPSGMKFMGVCMRFENLGRASNPIGRKCFGQFDMTPIDLKLVEAKADPSKVYVEGEYLWQFEGIATSKPFKLLKLKFIDRKYKNRRTQGEALLEQETNAIAIWTEWRLDSENSFSTGPIEDIQVGQPVKWAMNFKQGVHSVFPSRSKRYKLCHKTTFRNTNLLFDFSFKR